MDMKYVLFFFCMMLEVGVLVLLESSCFNSMHGGLKFKLL